MKKADKIKALEKALKLLKADKPSNTDKVALNRQKSEQWFNKKMNVSISERGLKVALPTKNGVQTYDGVKLSNGRTAVYLKSGYLKYAWN